MTNESDIKEKRSFRSVRLKMLSSAMLYAKV